MLSHGWAILTNCAGDADGGADDGVEPGGHPRRHLLLPEQLLRRWLPGARGDRQHRRVLGPIRHPIELPLIAVVTVATKGQFFCGTTQIFLVLEGTISTSLATCRHSVQG